MLNALSGQRGIFETFDEARAAARRTGLPSHEDPNQVTLHMELAKSLRTSDHPALFWLRAAADGHGLRVFDFGGNAGNLFYSYGPHLKSLGRLEWTVFDLPSVAKQGKKIAAERNAEGLSFASSPSEFRPDQVLLVSGALHYWETSIADFVRQFPVAPRHIVVNRTPITERVEPFAIVQRTATCAHPCIVRNAAQLIREFGSLGYLLVDRWIAPELRVRLPLFPGHSLPHYSGFYFRLENS
ncbi:MAG TPA: methyltransferase, TIGR04325 family [Candidatus Acidoferrales bacterium]|nr:methyltransferase, TIGR04325 family [Candidatus Acidoferrales bacterium]